MRDDITIAPAAPEDITAIHRIEVDSFPAPWRREFFSSEIDAEWRFNRVARRGRVIVGYLFAMFLLDEMHVNKIAVVARERRKGIADALMAECFAFARANSIQTISLEVRQSNAGAPEFYRHLDFERSYVRPRYYPDGESAVVMTREI